MIPQESHLNSRGTKQVCLTIKHEIPPRSLSEKKKSYHPSGDLNKRYDSPSLNS